MLRSMDAAVAGLRAHQSKLDVISNNIANVNTYGYKTQTYTFKEAMYQTSTKSTGGSGTSGGVNASQYGYGTMTGSIITDMSASTPTYVGGLNATVNGEGFFITCPSNAGVQGTKEGYDTEKGEFIKYDLTYTRVGQFKVDSQGYLTDANGNFVMGFIPDDANASGFDTTKLVPLRAPVYDTTNNKADFTNNMDASKTVDQLSSVSISALGEVTAQINVGGTATTISLGKIAIATFQNPEGLTKNGEFYYSKTENDNAGAASAGLPGEGTTSNLMTGYLEASNVDLSTQIAEMITTQRGFQANSKIITVSDEILNELVNMKR